MPLRLSPVKIVEMCRHAKDEYPHECCGIIIGHKKDQGETEIRPCRNIQNQLKEKYPDLYERSADTGYFMDPADVRKAFEESGKNGLEVIGFYHSHPDHDVYWSSEDHKAAMWAGTDEPSFPGAINVVISVNRDGVQAIAAFVWSEEKHDFVKTGLTES